MASFRPLIDSIQAISTGPYHLDKGSDATWRVLPGAPSREQSTNQLSLLNTLAAELFEAHAKDPIAVPELDVLVNGMRNLTLAPPPATFIDTLFHRTVNIADTEAFKRVTLAVSRHVSCAHLRDFESVKRSLEYLVQIDDINRFAAIFRAYYLPEPKTSCNKNAEPLDREMLRARAAAENEARTKFVQDVQQFINSLSDKDPGSGCSWLQRVKTDLDWPCSLVPLSISKKLKYLDLKECDEKAINAVLMAHSAYGFTQLRVSLNCSEEVFCRLADHGRLDAVMDLDLQECRELRWNGIQSKLARIKGLENVTLASTLVIDPNDIQWASHWQANVKMAVQDSLNVILSQQKTPGNYTYASDLMHGLEDCWSLGKKDRIQVNFLLTAIEEGLDDRPKKMGYLSASGIQRTTAQLMTRVNLNQSNLELYLSYCPHITREGFSHLFEKFSFNRLFFIGCDKIDDTYFKDHFLLKQQDRFTGELELAGTMVTGGMIQLLQKAQPRAKFHYLPDFLANLARKSEDSFGVDRQGLSDSALDVILHLKYTGTFPIVSLETAMELIKSDNTILESSSIRAELKEYCRYILQINVQRDNVSKLYEFAKELHDTTLIYICQVFIETFFSPALSRQWGKLSDAEKAIFQTILKIPKPPKPEFVFTDDILYTMWRPDQIHFSKDAAPLLDQVRNNDMVRFVRRWREADVSMRQAHVQKLVAMYPGRLWLRDFFDFPDRVSALVPKDKEEDLPKRMDIPKILDLRGFGVEQYVQVLSAFSSYTKLGVILNHAQYAFLHAARQGAFNKVSFLDLRECLVFEWAKIEPCLAQMQHLNNVLLPTSLSGVRPDLKLSDLWREELALLMRQNLIHIAAKQGQRHTHWFLVSTQFEAVSNIILLDVPNYDHKENYIPLTCPAINFLLQATEQSKKAVFSFSPQSDFVGMDVVTADLASSLIFYQKPLSLNFAYCRNITKKGLSSLFQSRTIERLSLFGCAHVDGSFLAEISTPCTLDLRGTSVSQEMVSKLQSSKIKVLYDPDYLPSRIAWENACQRNTTALTKPAFVALLYFHYTGYFPLLSIPIAMELFRCKTADGIAKERLMKLKEHCLHYMLLNVSKACVLELYYFAKEINEPTLLLITRYFIEIFCHPYYPLSKEHSSLNDAYKAILRDPPPKPIYFDPKIVTEKQEPFKPPKKEEARGPSANFGDGGGPENEAVDL